MQTRTWARLLRTCCASVGRDRTGAGAWALALAVLGPSAAPASAQLGFTELGLTDTDLNSSPETDFWIASAAPADVDGDGDLDLLVAGYFVVYFESVEERLTLYRNDGLADATTWALTPVPVDAGGLYFNAADIAWGDYDNDGDPDALVAAYGETALFRNDGGTLVRTATVLPAYLEDSGFSTLDQRSVSWADYDNDGDPDLLLPAQWTSTGYEPTALLRNDGVGAGSEWTFTDAGAALPQAPNAVSVWADADDDGDLDLLLGNVSPYGDNFLETWRNEAGSLLLADSGLAFVRYGTADWGDVDDDGDLDVVYAGNIDLPDGTGETVARILFADGQGGYTPFDVARSFQDPEEPWLDFNAVTWADYDSDGDMDLLVSGEWLGNSEILGRSRVYANEGGAFSVVGDPLPAPIAGNAGGAFTWFDVDSDGDLDYFVAGAYYVPNGNGLVEARTQLFRNDAPGGNAPPSAPSNLVSSPSGGTGVTLSWSPATDDRTPAGSLTYTLDVTPLAAPAPSGRVLPEPGNVSTNTSWSLHGLTLGLYRWQVRALDHAFNGGEPARGVIALGDPGTGFCSGDGSLVPCPCGNDGAAGHGCASSFSAGGALLVATGEPAQNSVVLAGADLPAATTVVVIRAPDAQQVAPAAFGDGLSCLGGSVVRLGATQAQAGVSLHPLNHGAGPGLFDYQLWYRNQQAFCTPAAFNTSNGLRIAWP